MFCSGKFSLIIIYLVLGLLPISSDFSGSADTSSTWVNLASDWGLASRYLPIPLVKLLTHRCTIACDIKSIGSIVPVPLSTGSHRPEFLRQSVLGCTDFPHPEGRDYPATLFCIYYTIIRIFCNIEKQILILYNNRVKEKPQLELGLNHFLYKAICKVAIITNTAIAIFISHFAIANLPSRHITTNSVVSRKGFGKCFLAYKKYAWLL